jgi:hypothetical protein
MRIGSDFDKMEFSWFGLDLLEPNALLSDSLITVFGFIFAFLVIRNFPTKQPFYKYWKWLFILQGTSFFFGGLGHVLYNYTGIWGKFAALSTAVFFIMMVEHAMISLLNEKQQKKFILLSKIKAVAAVVALTVVMFTVDVENNLPVLLIVPSANTAIGYFTMLFFLGWKFARTKSRALYLLPISVLTLIPAAILQAKKINLHPWFDRNDFSHLLIIISLFMYYYAIKGYYRDTRETSSIR